MIDITGWIDKIEIEKHFKSGTLLTEIYYSGYYKETDLAFYRVILFIECVIDEVIEEIEQ